MEIRVNPTRMELLRLKKRLIVAQRGHKLLKDKLDEMMKQFLELVKENRSLREQVEGELGDAARGFLLARAVMSTEFLVGAIAFPKNHMELSAGTKKVMAIEVPRFKLESHDEGGQGLPYGLAQTSGELDQAVLSLTDAFPALVNLAEVEKTVELVAAEIEKTRRRVNALEYVLIPQLQEKVRYITMKLDENERGNLTRLMKVKDIVRAKT